MPVHRNTQSNVGRFVEKYQIPSSAIPELNSKGKSDSIAPIKVEPETYIQFRVERFSNPLDMRKN